MSFLLGLPEDIFQEFILEIQVTENVDFCLLNLKNIINNIYTFIMFVYYFLVISIKNIYHSFNVQNGMLAMKVLNNQNDIKKNLSIMNLVFQLLRGKK